MWFKRAFYWLQLVAIIVAPLWIVIARAIAPTGLGAQDVLVFLSWPALALAMIAVVAITWGRRAVRHERAVSWTDVAALSVWYLVAIAFGVFISLSSQLGAGLTGGLLVLVSIAVVWVAIWQLVEAARRRVRTVLSGLDQRAVPAGDYRATRSSADDANVIRIDRRDAEPSTR